MEKEKLLFLQSETLMQKVNCRFCRHFFANYGKSSGFCLKGEPRPGKNIWDFHLCDQFEYVIAEKD